MIMQQLPLKWSPEAILTRQNRGGGLWLTKTSYPPTKIPRRSGSSAAEFEGLIDLGDVPINEV